MSAHFDTVVVVDWSAASVPSPARPAADAVWIGVAAGGSAQGSGERVEYFRTRATAEAALTDLLHGEKAAGRRVLVGFDFALGYPAGFAERLTGQAEARAVWEWMAARIEDAADNRNNRFQVADAVNRAFGGAGPFWGRPAGLALADLPATKAVDYAALGLGERRAVERAVPRAQPVWKLFTTGSVGSQVLTGLPMVHRLSQAAGVAVWPFDGVDQIAQAQVVLAEIYPSLLAGAVAAEAGIKDAAQVRLLARALLRLALAGRMADLMRLPPDVPPDEGWILGAGHEGALRDALGRDRCV